MVTVLLARGEDPAARWTASAYAVLIAVIRSGSMLRALLGGRWGIDLLAVTAIGATVAAGEYVAALIIVLNDAPVLAAAEVGVAMGAKGSTAASESADVVIMLDDLSRAALAVDIGQRTMRIALASIWIGILLSVGLMVAAVFGFIPAVAGALLQELVDLATILNALRALRGGRKASTTAVGGAPVSVGAVR